MSSVRTSATRTKPAPIRVTLIFLSLVLGMTLATACSSDGQKYDRDDKTGETVTTSTSTPPTVTATTVPAPDSGTSPEVDPEDGSNEGTLPPNGSTEQQGGDGSTGYTPGGGDIEDDGDSVGG